MCKNISHIVLCFEELLTLCILTLTWQYILNVLILHQIFLNDSPERKYTKLAMYAFNIGIFRIHRDYKFAIKNVNTHFAERLHKWKIKIHTTKSGAVMLTKIHVKTYTNRNINIQKTPILSPSPPKVNIYELLFIANLFYSPI